MTAAPRRPPARWACTLVLVLTSMLLTGCTVGPQPAPERIQSARPYHRPQSRSSDGAVIQMTIYLVKDGHLAGVSRAVPSTAGLDGLLAALGAGPTTQESAEGYRTALPAGTTALNGRVLDGIVYLAVPSGLDSLGVTGQVTAVGQMVYTVTEIDGVSGLQLTNGEHDVEIPVSGGALVSGPVGRSDYAPIAPR